MNLGVVLYTAKDCERVRVIIALLVRQIVCLIFRRVFFLWGCRWLSRVSRAGCGVRSVGFGPGFVCLVSMLVCPSHFVENHHPLVVVLHASLETLFFSLYTRARMGCTGFGRHIHNDMIIPCQFLHIYLCCLAVGPVCVQRCVDRPGPACRYLQWENRKL